MSSGPAGMQPPPQPNGSAMAPMQPAPAPGFVAGLKSLFSGMGWTFATPSVWPLALVPIVLVVLVTIGLSIASVAFVPDLIASLIGPTSSTLGGVGAGALKVLATVLTIVLSGFVAFSIAQPLAGPALEGIVRRKEVALGFPPRANTNLLVDIWRSLQSLLIGYAFGLPALVILLILSLLLPFAAVVTVPLKLLVAAFTIAWDICDYPLSLRGMPVGERVRIILRYRNAVFGFSFALALAALVPCLLFLFLPAGVAGGARLMCEVERYELSQGRPMGAGKRP